MDYVLRMHALAIHTEPLDIQIEGIAIQNGLPSIVTSMAYIHGPVKGFTFRNAHPGNFVIAAPGIFVPIDVAIESP